jgi:hypothetical protein
MALSTCLCAVCFGSQQNRTALPTRIRHGRKQGNGGTHQAAEAINSYGLFEAAGVKTPSGFFLIESAIAERSWATRSLVPGRVRRDDDDPRLGVLNRVAGARHAFAALASARLFSPGP